MTTANAQTKMKALVASRLLMRDINNWRVFEQERETARKIANRHTARSVSSQIGRGYRELSIQIQQFIAKNFSRCDYNDLARLCDAIEPGTGLYLRVDEFEKAFFPLAESLKRRFPSTLMSAFHSGDCSSSTLSIIFYRTWIRDSTI